MNQTDPSHIDLQAIVKQIMLVKGFHPDFPPAVQQQVGKIETPRIVPDANIRDLRSLQWS